ncbi:MAG: DEAD/DEAH box helicase family protein [Dehalococcoidia bacterium]|nr:DEAD/DEAH box helicase family protein [Dehalococcoidia bacterium]
MLSANRPPVRGHVHGDSAECDRLRAAATRTSATAPSSAPTLSSRPPLAIHWDFDCYVRGDSERGHSAGALYLTNIQQLYEREPKDSGMPDPMAGVLGPDPRTASTGSDDFLGRLTRRGGPVLVINDEAHHTHDPGNEWMRAISRINTGATVGLQLDFTATPRFNNGVIFPDPRTTTRSGTQSTTASSNGHSRGSRTSTRRRLTTLPRATRAIWPPEWSDGRSIATNSRPAASDRYCSSC